MKTSLRALPYKPEKWPLVKDRVSYLVQLAAGLEVLDVGCTGKKADGHFPDRAATLHQALKPVCKTIVGVDSDEDGIKLMAHAGFQVICDDIATMDLQRTFDLIIAGEVVEHLPNPGLALKNLGKHLNKAGRLVVTTCNPFYYRQQSKILRKGLIQVHPEHTAWYDPITLGFLLNRSGFQVIRGAWLSSRKRWNPMLLLAKRRKYWNPNFLIVATPK
jgi:2-polyprenyl-3-methyl-5-hydroxy-6-metoxy-1,4-benzoquinol methylase